MLRQSWPKIITCHFNSSQKTIAERYALTQYLKNTWLDLRTSNILISSTPTVDEFISKTIMLLRISHYCTEKCDLSFQLTYHMISVHVSALFKKTFHYGGNQYVSVITVPKNMTSTYISHDFSTVHISKDFSLRNQSRKTCRRTKRYCMQKKYPWLAKKRGDQCSSPDIADHPSDTPRLLLSPSVPVLRWQSGKNTKYGQSRQNKCKRKETNKV